MPLLYFSSVSIDPLLGFSWTSTGALVDLAWTSTGPLVDLSWTSTGPPTGPLLGEGPPEDGNPDVPRKDCLWSVLAPFSTSTGSLLDLY